LLHQFFQIAEAAFPGEHALLDQTIIIMTMVTDTPFIELDIRVTGIHQTARANVIISFHVHPFRKNFFITTKVTLRLRSGQASGH
jgi:hypothetical protein